MKIIYDSNCREKEMLDKQYNIDNKKNNLSLINLINCISFNIKGK